MTEQQRRFLDHHRVARLATADAKGRPHVVPVCYAVDADTVYIAIDQKPKRPGPALKRLRNIAENPSVALVIDHYEDDWTRLGWVMLRGQARLLADGPSYTRAHVLLRERYPQYATMTLAGLPVIAVRIERVASWGRLDI